MKIKIIVPVATNMWNKGAYQICSNVASSETEIEITNIKNGPVSIESIYDETYAAPYVVDEAQKAEKEGFDGIIIYCFGNPGLEAAREALSIPIVGIGETAQIMGMIVGERLGIISTIENAVPRHWRKVKVLGTINKIKAIKPLKLPVLEYKNQEKVLEEIKKVASEMIEKEDIDCIILGCGSIMGIKDELKKFISVPIIIPGEAAIKIIEALVKMRISHSKLSYMFPPKKEYF